MTIQKNIILAPWTNFKVGGIADLFIEAKSTADVREAVAFAKEKKIPIAILGGGTNILVADAGFRGLIVRIAMTSLTIEDDLIVADAGCTIGQVVVAAQKNGLSGLEWAVGLPGTVGGAVFGNAGCFGGEIKDHLGSVALFDPATGKVLMQNATTLGLSYRHSALKDSGLVVLAATFNLKKAGAEEIAAGMERIRQKAMDRIKEQPLGARTAGSTFKGVKMTPELGSRNLELGIDLKQGINRAGFVSAGFLLEKAGLKGYRIGGASFSAHHANFIINHGDATAKDISNLIDAAKSKVKDRFGIVLEEEIRYIGFEDRL